jgi:DNA-binding transcriptional ArsR family regulator
MSSGNEYSDKSEGSDPRKLRALAHPVRLDLLYLLHREGPLTASRAAELLGLTPKACSYHLNLLGKYGVVEETGEGKGRARPWRVATADLTYVHRPDEQPETTHAEDAFARTMLARDVRQIESFIDQRRWLPQRWRNVSAMSSNPLRLTPDQLGALRDELMEVLGRYQELSRTPAAGAHPVHAALYALPADLAGLISPEDPDAPESDAPPTHAK